MSWLTIIWSASATASAILAAMHLFLWFNDRTKPFYLWSSLACLAAAFVAAGELALMKSTSFAMTDQALLWQLPPIALLLVSLTWFIFKWFGTGKRWLAATITGVWLIVLADAFIFPGNGLFSEITELEPHKTMWGESYVIVRGILDPTKWLGDLASILFLAFVIDASVRLWRQGQPRRALVVGGAIILFILTAGVHTPLVDSGIIKTPYMIGFFFQAIIICLTYELLRDVVRATRNADELRSVRREMEHVGRVNLLGELSAALAHELNQPLAAILANAEAGSRFLKASEPDLEEVAAALQDIANEDKRASKVIRRLRSMLQKGDPVRETTDLNHAVEESVELLAHEMMTNAVMLDLNLSDDLPPVNIDRLAFQQVMVNLLLNAEQAAVIGAVSEPKVQIQTRAEGDFVIVEVSDNGPGIESATLTKVFDPFYTTKSSGIGMGLSICRSIIENHGGEIEAENQEGSGATFKIFLPLENSSPTV